MLAALEELYFLLIWSILHLSEFHITAGRTPWEVSVMQFDKPHNEQLLLSTVIVFIYFLKFLWEKA